MILTQLVNLYDRMAEDEEYSARLPLLGWSIQNVVYRVVLTHDGELFDIQDVRTERKFKKNGKDKVDYVPRKMIVPGYDHSPGKGSSPRFLWDKAEYMFGYAGPKGDSGKAVGKHFPAFRVFHLELQKQYAIADSGYSAVCRFLDSFDPKSLSREMQEKIDKCGLGVGVFYLQGEEMPVFDSEELKSVWHSIYHEECNKLPRGNCLVTGRKQCQVADVIEPKIKLGDKGGAIACFNDAAYTSYGKKQTLNSPISFEAGTKAYNALNHLLLNNRFHVKVADTTVVFWTGKKTQTESLLGMLFGTACADASSIDGAVQEKLKVLWKIVGKAGDPNLAELGDDAQTPFYMLGIEPNDARVVIRFWHESSLGDLIVKLRRHHADMAIGKTFEGDSDHLPMWQIVRQTARDADGVPPLLSGALLRSVIEGLPYPESLYQLVLNRIHVSHRDQNGKYRVGGKVTYAQVSVVKGFLNRNKKKGVTEMLDENNRAPAYLLGRLFATLEKTQGEALGDLNAGVGDKYYSAASATPRIVFPTILDMFRKWIKKLGAEKKGLAVVREKLVGEILDGLDSTTGFPANLSLEDRGMFAIGYYQQMRVFFTKKDDAESSK